MASIRTREELREAINLLEATCLVHRQEIISSMNNTIDSLNPLRFIKNTVQKVKSVSMAKEKAVNTIVGLGVNLILRKIMPTRPGSYLKTILISLLQSILIGREEESIDPARNHNYHSFNGTADIED